MQLRWFYVGVDIRADSPLSSVIFMIVYIIVKFPFYTLLYLYSNHFSISFPYYVINEVNYYLGI